jgi:hypothetical protein
MLIGAGTALNVTSILVGSAVGVALGGRFPARTRELVTDALGLVTLLVAAMSAAAVVDPALRAATGSGAPVLIVLGSLLVGGIGGSLLRIEAGVETLGERVRRTAARVATRRDGGPAGDRDAGPTGSDPPSDGQRRVEHERFVEGFVTASLVFCVGPLTVLGALSDGLGRGIDQLVLKSSLDGFASIAFAASLGWGVAASALSVLVVQGAWTAVGALLGEVLPEAHVAALTATGGLLLVGVGLRLLRVRQVPVADLLPALLVAPLLTEAVVRLR